MSCRCPGLCGAKSLWLGNPQGARMGVLSSRWFTCCFLLQECDLVLSSSAFWLDFSGVKPAEVWGFTDAMGLEVIAGWVESSSLCLLAPSSTLQLRQISDVGGALHCPCMLLVGDLHLCCQTAAAGRTVGLNSSLYTAFCPCNSTGLWSYAWQRRCHTVSSYLGALWNWTKLTWS